MRCVQRVRIQAIPRRCLRPPRATPQPGQRLASSVDIDPQGELIACVDRLVGYNLLGGVYDQEGITKLVTGVVVVE